MKFESCIIAVFSVLLLTSCLGEPNEPPAPVENTRQKVTYAEVRHDIHAGGDSFKKDLSNRLEILDIFMEDVMKAYRTADEQRREQLKPQVEQFKRLKNRVEGQVEAYTPGKEQRSEKQVHQIIDTMQALRATYHDLVQKLGVIWK